MTGSHPTRCSETLLVSRSPLFDCISGRDCPYFCSRMGASRAATCFSLPRSEPFCPAVEKKFHDLARRNIPTGDPNIPPQVREAKRVRALIYQKSNGGTGSVSDGFGVALGPDDNNDVDVEMRNSVPLIKQKVGPSMMYSIKKRLLAITGRGQGQALQHLSSTVGLAAQTKMGHLAIYSS